MALDDASRFTIEWTCTRLVHLYANLNDAHDWETLAVWLRHIIGTW